MNITWVILAALSLLLSVSAENSTYEAPPDVCDNCEPDTRLKADFTETLHTECQSCPTGFYSQSLDDTCDCLRCDLCTRNQEETQPCTTTQNQVCQCREGYYWLSYLCKKHTVCPVGHWVKTQGTPTKDTECEACVDGHYAAGAAGSKQCTPHTPCLSNQRLVISGTNWHDNICVTCEYITRRGWSRLIRPLLSELFAQQKSRRMDRVVRYFLPRRERPLPDMQEWLSGAAQEQLTELPDVLTRAGIPKLAIPVEDLIKKIEDAASNCSNSNT